MEATGFLSMMLPREVALKEKQEEALTNASSDNERVQPRTVNEESCTRSNVEPASVGGDAADTLPTNAAQYGDSPEKSKHYCDGVLDEESKNGMNSTRTSQYLSDPHSFQSLNSSPDWEKSLVKKKRRSVSSNPVPLSEHADPDFIAFRSLAIAVRNSDPKFQEEDLASRQPKKMCSRTRTTVITVADSAPVPSPTVSTRGDDANGMDTTVGGAVVSLGTPSYGAPPRPLSSASGLVLIDDGGPLLSTGKGGKQNAKGDKHPPWVGQKGGKKMGYGGKDSGNYYGGKNSGKGSQQHKGTDADEPWNFSRNSVEEDSILFNNAEDWEAASARKGKKPRRKCMRPHRPPTDSSVMEFLERFRLFDPKIQDLFKFLPDGVLEVITKEKRWQEAVALHSEALTKALPEEWIQHLLQQSMEGDTGDKNDAPEKAESSKDSLGALLRSFKPGTTEGQLETSQQTSATVDEPQSTKDGVDAYSVWSTLSELSEQTSACKSQASACKSQTELDTPNNTRYPALSCLSFEKRASTASSGDFESLRKALFASSKGFITAQAFEVILRRIYEENRFFTQMCACEVFQRDILTVENDVAESLVRDFEAANLVRKMRILSYFYCECQGYFLYKNGRTVCFGRQVLQSDITSQETDDQAKEDSQPQVDDLKLDAKTVDHHSDVPEFLKSVAKSSEDSIYPKDFLEEEEPCVASTKEMPSLLDGGSLATTGAGLDANLDANQQVMSQDFLEDCLKRRGVEEYMVHNELDGPTATRLQRQPAWLIEIILAEGPLLTAHNASACVVLRMNQLRDAKLEKIVWSFYSEYKEQCQPGAEEPPPKITSHMRKYSVYVQDDRVYFDPRAKPGSGEEDHDSDGKIVTTNSDINVLPPPTSSEHSSTEFLLTGSVPEEGVPGVYIANSHASPRPGEGSSDDANDFTPESTFGIEEELNPEIFLEEYLDKYEIRSTRVRNIFHSAPSEVGSMVILGGPISKNAINPAAVLLSRMNRASRILYGTDIVQSGRLNRAICKNGRFVAQIQDIDERMQSLVTSGGFLAGVAQGPPAQGVGKGGMPAGATQLGRSYGGFAKGDAKGDRKGGKKGSAKGMSSNSMMGSDLESTWRGSESYNDQPGSWYNNSGYYSAPGSQGGKAAVSTPNERSSKGLYKGGSLSSAGSGKKGSHNKGTASRSTWGQSESWESIVPGENLEGRTVNNKIIQGDNPTNQDMYSSPPKGKSYENSFSQNYNSSGYKGTTTHGNSQGNNYGNAQGTNYATGYNSQDNRSYVNASPAENTKQYRGAEAPRSTNTTDAYYEENYLDSYSRASPPSASQMRGTRLPTSTDYHGAHSSGYYEDRRDEAQYARRDDRPPLPPLHNVAQSPPSRDTYSGASGNYYNNDSYQHGYQHGRTSGPCSHDMAGRMRESYNRDGGGGSSRMISRDDGYGYTVPRDDARWQDEHDAGMHKVTEDVGKLVSPHYREDSSAKLGVLASSEANQYAYHRPAAREQTYEQNSASKGYSAPPSKAPPPPSYGRYGDETSGVPIHPPPSRPPPPHQYYADQYNASKGNPAYERSESHQRRAYDAAPYMSNRGPPGYLDKDELYRGAAADDRQQSSYYGEGTHYDYDKASAARDRLSFHPATSYPPLSHNTEYHQGEYDRYAHYDSTNHSSSQGYKSTTLHGGGKGYTGYDFGAP